MLSRVALVRTYVSEECSATIIRVTRIGELGTTLAVTSNRLTLRRNTFLHFVLLTLFLARRFLSPWWWRRYVPPKRRFLQGPHSVTSQKTVFFIVTAVKASNLTLNKLLRSYKLRYYLSKKRISRVLRMAELWICEKLVKYQGVIWLFPGNEDYHNRATKFVFASTHLNVHKCLPFIHDHYPFCKVWGFHGGAVFWDIMPRGSCKNRRFGGTSFLIATQRNIPEDGIPHSPISSLRREIIWKPVANRSAWLAEGTLRNSLFPCVLGSAAQPLGP
jgi:hypothetical protein